MALVYASWCDSELGGKFPPLQHKNMWQMQKSENWIQEMHEYNLVKLENDQMSPAQFSIYFL